MEVSTDRRTATSVTRSQVAVFRLTRHHLVDRAPAAELISVVHSMAGAQAQLLSAAQISLWARVRNLRSADVGEALADRRLVKASCMRRTLFLAPAEQLAIFVRGSARCAEKEVRWARGKGVSDRDLDAAMDATLSALDRPLTRPEIAERVSRSLGASAQDVHGGGWGSRRKVAAVPVGELTYPVVDLLHLAAARGVVCYGPDQGHEPTFVRADAWLPRWQDVAQEQAEGELLRLYLQAFGPSTAADFAGWTGMTLRDARAIWAREQAGLAPVDVEGWAAAVLEEDLAALVQARLESPPARLLPYFDSFLLGHKAREHLVPLECQPQVFRPQGWIAPVVLVDGRAVAVWAHARQGNRLEVALSGFRPLSPDIVAAIRDEAHDLSRFLGASGVNVQVG